MARDIFADPQVGDTVYWNKQPMKVTKTGLPGKYGPRIELDSTIVTTPALDHRLTRTASEPPPPPLSTLLWEQGGSHG